MAGRILRESAPAEMKELPLSSKSLNNDGQPGDELN
jgi:hypothetical protein